MSYFQGETPDNYEQKCLCTLVLDTSGSMGGEPIRELNRGLQEFYAAIEEDLIAANRLEVSIVTFGSRINTIQEPSLIEGFDMPTLGVSGTTRLVDAVREAMRKTEERKQWYKETGQPYYRPIVVLITDGEPDRDQDVNGISAEIREAVEGKRFTFFGLGVKGYNHATLQRICPPTAPPMPLAGYKFSEFFKWLSNSIGIITKSKEGETIELPPISDWAQMKF
ncbi:vWA domain-containing protein [Saprospira grandis]|uniref:von Willebrand factor type A n=1 Tax=Saprospira grandis (strain Lewin) TaxID=984262 RepID=H6L9Q7_SAPGL|nr:VWA domain-containing protein [Saprospira grandis]AFC23235.1 von Willebrand factor type A [Saprospira grandis str. Lewin]WBM74972.1 VWA domain-containing protein [Saprospira grandis]